MSRRARFGAALTSLIALFVGLVTLAGLLIGDNLGGLTAAADLLRLETFANFFIRLTAVTIAVTIVIGITNLMQVHVGRVLRRRADMFYSIVVLVAFIGTLVVYFTGNTELSRTLLEDVQLPIESALAGLLFVTLVYGAFRLIRDHATRWHVLFLIVLLIVLIGALPFGETSIMAEVSTWLMNVPISAGARGILLGIALATIVTGIRVLIGQDRSYRG